MKVLVTGDNRDFVQIGNAKFGGCIRAEDVGVSVAWQDPYEDAPKEVPLRNIVPEQKAQDAWEFRPKKPKMIPPKIVRK